MMTQTSSTNEELLNALPGFQEFYASVNGVHLHYVSGGKGNPLILLPGWPETWWAYHKVMPLLAQHYEVIAVDIRGMGHSDKPLMGYDKKNMAQDLAELITHLGYSNAYVAGHDIGAHVAFSLAANHPKLVSKLILLDTPHPTPDMFRLPMLPTGSMAEGSGYTYPWWVAFNQLKQLPEQVLAGRMRIILDWVFDHLLLNKNSIDTSDRAVYAAAYDTEAGIRASNAWYQAFLQDIEDSKTYAALPMPVLGIGASGYELLNYTLLEQATQWQVVQIEESGHFLLAEQPAKTARAMMEFLG